MTERQKQAAATRRKIIKAARELISENGYDDVSVEDIVVRCGIAKGTFYHHFKSKEDIVVCLSDSIYDHLQKGWESIADHSFMECIHWLITTWYQEMNALNLHIARETLKFYMDAKADDQYGARFSHVEEGIDLFRKVMMNAIAKGELCAKTPVMILSQALMFAIQGSAVYHCKQEDNFDIMDWNKNFLANVVDPLLKPYLVLGD